MTRKNTATLKTPKNQKTPVHRVRKGRHELEPVHGILPPASHGKPVATKKKVVIPPPEIAMVEVDDVWINDAYQRNLLQNGIDDLVAEYEGLNLQESVEKFHEGCGVTLSARRKDGRISQIDGQRRVALAKWLKDTHEVESFFIPTEIVTTSGNDHEAQMFKMRNHRKKLSHCEVFKGDLAAGDPEAVGIDRCLDKFRLAVKGVSKTKRSRRVTCVKQLYEAWRADGTGGHLEKVIQTLRDSWAVNSNPRVSASAYKSMAVGPMSVFLMKNRKVNLAELARKLGRYRLSEVIDMVPSNRIGTGYGRNAAIAEEGIAKIYNSQARRVHIF